MTTPNIGIAIVAPGGCAQDETAVLRGLARLEQEGFRVHNYYEHGARFQRFGGTDAARLAQLHAANADPEVAIVMALRGQYGISRLLPAIDFKALAASGKLFVGYSDMTALHMGLLAQTGRISYAGTMLCDDYTREEPVAWTLDNFTQCLAGPTHSVKVAVAGNPSLSCQGTLWGGNLSMLVHLVGTPFFPAIDGGILFVEDVNEHPYRIERMLLQLLHAGVLARQRALILGDVSAYKLGPADNGYDFEAMLAFLRAHLPIPVLTGLPFGHTPHRVTLPVGAPAQLVSDADGFTLTVSDYPRVQHG